MADVFNWIEIPASDFTRALKFYSAVLGTTIEPGEFGGLQYSFLPMEGTGVGGALVAGEGYAPGGDGPVVYFNGGEDLTPMLARAEAAGATVILPKTGIGEGSGFFALFIDSEGNRVGLHSMN
jgi:predicted enzyme related to lactoylglutathione lyase